MNVQRQRFVGVLTAAVIGAAMTVSAAQARPDDRGGLLGVGGATSEQTDRPDDRPGLLGVGGAVPASQVEQQAAVRPDDRGELRGPGTTPPATVFSPAVTDDGVQWGSVEIATGVALLMAVLAAATLLMSHRRERAIRY
jgi:hypothetical protein